MTSNKNAPANGVMQSVQLDIDGGLFSPGTIIEYESQAQPINGGGLRLLRLGDSTLKKVKDKDGNLTFVAAYKTSPAYKALWENPPKSSPICHSVQHSEIKSGSNSKGRPIRVFTSEEKTDLEAYIKTYKPGAPKRPLRWDLISEKLPITDSEDSPTEALGSTTVDALIRLVNQQNRLLELVINSVGALTDAVDRSLQISSTEHNAPVVQVHNDYRDVLARLREASEAEKHVKERLSFGRNVDENVKQELESSTVVK